MTANEEKKEAQDDEKHREGSEPKKIETGEWRKSREAGAGPGEAGRDLIGLGGVQLSPPLQGGGENVPFSL